MSLLKMKVTPTEDAAHPAAFHLTPRYGISCYYFIIKVSLLDGKNPTGRQLKIPAPQPSARYPFYFMWQESQRANYAVFIGCSSQALLLNAC